MITKDFTIFIIKNELKIYNSLQALFESVKFKVEIYDNMFQFKEKFNTRKKGCIIIKLCLSEINGYVQLLDYFKKYDINIPIIIITEQIEIHTAIQAMKLGAKDLLLKPINEQYLLESVQKCLRKFEKIDSNTLIKERINSLSEREAQILQLIMDGMLNKEIAYELTLSISTVEAHRANIKKKMHAKNLAELIKFYSQIQWEEER